MTRRDCLSLALIALARPARTAAAQNTARGRLERRIADLVHEFELQGDHRTGTEVDRRSAGWLSAHVAASGLAPSLEPFPLNRVDPIETTLIVGARHIQGVPLFDAAPTEGAGISGRLGALDSDADIGLAQTVPNQAAAGPLGNARRAGRHKAIVCITRGQRPGLCPSNADLFRQPFGPPVLQVSSEHAQTLDEQAHEEI